MQSNFLYLSNLGSHLSQNLVSLYIVRVSTLFSKNSLISINYNVGPQENYLNTPPFISFFFFFLVLQFQLGNLSLGILNDFV